MAAEDDFAAFLAEIQTTETVATDDASAAPDAEAGEKRTREDDQPATTAEEETAAPVLKKAKVVVARAKPQVFQAPPQPAPEPAPQPQPVRADYNSYGPAGGGGGGAASSSSGYGRPAAPSYGGSFHGQPSHGEAYGKGPAQHAAFGGGGGPGGGVPGQEQKKKKFVRVGAGETWVDPTLSDWPDNDFRLFCGDLGNEVNDEMLANAFKQYSSFAMARVIRDKSSGKSKGYGFVSFLDPFDGLKAYREMNNKYLGTRPLKLRKSDWKERNLNEIRKKEKKKKAFMKQLGISG